MAQRTRPPFRADHVGSLLRPERLREARADFKAGTIDADELRAVEDDAIREVIALQRDAGLQDATDGEFRRTSWHMDFIYSLGGDQPGRGRAPARALPQRGGRVRLRAARHEAWTARSRCPRRPIFGDAFAFLRDTAQHERHAEAHDPVAEHGPLPRRQLLDRRVGLPRPRRVLDRPDGRVQRADARRVRARRPLPAARRHEPRLHQRPGAARAHRGDRRRPRAPARAVHRATSTARWPASPDDLAVTTHLCRGNNQSMWAAEGGYDFVAEALFNDLERRRLLPRVRRRALGHVRAAALRAQGQDGRARAGDDEEARSSRTRTCSSAGSRRRRSTSTSTSCASRRSAASPPPRRATS